MTISQRDEYEAKSRRHSNRVIILLELDNGNIAVFNNARILTGVIDTQTENPNNKEDWPLKTIIKHIRDAFWKEPTSSFTTVVYEDKDLPSPQPKPVRIKRRQPFFASIDLNEFAREE